MTNLEAVRHLCNAIANTFYPDFKTIELALLNQGIDKDADVTAKDANILRVAVSLVMGYVETSRNENGVSTGVNRDAVEESIKYWCNLYGVSADEILGDDSFTVIQDGTHLW